MLGGGYARWQRNIDFSLCFGPAAGLTTSWLENAATNRVHSRILVPRSRMCRMVAEHRLWPVLRARRRPDNVLVRKRRRREGVKPGVKRSETPG